MPPSIENAEVNAPSTLFEDEAVYTCVQGFETADNTSSENITCQQNKTWTEGPTCTSMGLAKS